MRTIEQKFLAASIGCLAGFFAALVISYFLFPLVGTVPADVTQKVVDTHHLIHPENRETNFYRLSLVLGFGGGFLALFLLRWIKRFTPLLVGFFPLVAAYNFALMNMIKSISPGDFYTQADMGAERTYAALVSGVPFILVLIGIVFCCALPLGRRTQQRKLAAPPMIRLRTIPRWLMLLLAALLITMVFMPYPSISEPTALNNCHRQSFFVGPGLYRRAAEHVVAGKDYSVQYGLAQSFISGLFLEPSLSKTITKLNMFNAWVKALFFLGLFVFCWCFLKRVWSAWFILISAMALQFMSGENADGSFFESTLVVPSVGVYRHLFIPVIWLLTYFFLQNPRWRWGAALGAVLGLQVFWINDTGLAAIITVSAAILMATGQPWYQRVLSWLAVTSGAMMVFLILGVIVYGKGFLAIDYIEMVKYMKVFAYGFGSAKAHWSFLPLDLVMYIFSTLLIVATVVMSVAGRSRVYGPLLLCIALYAAMVKLKFINQTSSQHFFGDAFALMVLVGFWVQKLILVRFPNSHWLVMALMLVVVFDPAEKHRGIHAGIRSYYHSPQSFMLAHWLHGGRDKEQAVPPLTYTPPEDKRVIEKYSKPGERIFLISYDDVAYLLESGRAPASPFVPMMDMVFAKNFDEFFRNARQKRYIFIDIRGLNSPLAQTLVPYFDVKDKGEYVLVLGNKDNSLYR